MCARPDSILVNLRYVTMLQYKITFMNQLSLAESVEVRYLFKYPIPTDIPLRRHT